MYPFCPYVYPKLHSSKIELDSKLHICKKKTRFVYVFHLIFFSRKINLESQNSWCFGNKKISRIDLCRKNIFLLHLKINYIFINAEIKVTYFKNLNSNNAHKMRERESPREPCSSIEIAICAIFLALIKVKWEIIKSKKYN